MRYGNILVIDDDEDDLEIFVAAVNELSGSATCTPVSDAHSALESLKKKTLDPDVIFLDLNMPVMNGRQFLTLVKSDQSLRDIPVIIFSTSSHSETIEETKQLGANGFITKPNSFSDLKHVLSAYII